jgi:signal transduction histidine kinase
VISGPELRELQRFAELGRLSASLLHEISNPLSAAMLNLELGDQQSRSVQRARRDMQTLKRYIEAARQQVRHQSQPTSFRVRPQLDQLKRIVIPLARKTGVRLDISPAPPCRLYGDPVKFQQIISNLIVNAIEAYDYSGAYDELRLVKVELAHKQGFLTVRVTDWGKGIDGAALPRLFDTFYTTKNQSGRGLGIGLAIVKQYVTTDFQGSIEVTSSKQRGTRFTARLRDRSP